MSANISPPQLGKRERAKAANRDAIIEASRKVFASIGYESATVRDIIRETDLAAGTFYNYFKSKEEVFEAVAKDSVLRFAPHLETVKSNAKDLESYVYNAYRAYFQFFHDENMSLVQEGGTGAPLLGIRVDGPEMAAISEQIFADFSTILGPTDLPLQDIEYLAAAGIGMARELGDQMLRQCPIDVEKTTQFATKLLLRGIGSVLD